MTTHPDVLIIGGGVIGLTTAYCLAGEGTTVEVLDRGDLAHEASWAGAGIIPPGNPDRAATPYDLLRGLSSRMFGPFSEELRARTGTDNGYRVCGGIEFLEPGDEPAIDAWRAEGIEHQRLDEKALRKLEPALGTTPGTAYHLPGMAQVRNPWHMRALIDVCQRRSVRLQPNRPADGFEVEGDRVLAVRLAGGERVAAERFLIAAGAWGDQLLAHLGCPSGIHPVRGQIVLLRAEAPPVRRVLLHGKNYLVPREDGRVLVGATEEPEAGFVKQTTAEAVAGLIRLATGLVLSLSGAEVERCWAGLRPGSADGLPVMGAVPGWRNVFVAGGHFRAGIQLSPGTGRVLADLIRGRTPLVPLDDFRPGRVPKPPGQTAFRS